MSEQFVIDLESNPTTGYLWESLFDSSMLKLKDSFLKLYPSGLIGGGGVEEFVFTPLKSGETVITMVLKRPWENKPLDKKTYRIEIFEKESTDV